MTHCHPDHIGSAAALKREVPYAIIYVSELDAPIVSKMSLRRLWEIKFNIACFGHGKPIMKDASQRFQAKWGAVPK